MRRQIWKFNLTHEIFRTLLSNDHPVIRMPAGAQVLTVQVQGADVMLWAMIDPEAEPVSRQFWVLGTGQDADFDLEHYVGTWQQRGADGQLLVFHLFDAGWLD